MRFCCSAVELQKLPWAESDPIGERRLRSAHRRMTAGPSFHWPLATGHWPRPAASGQRPESIPQAGLSEIARARELPMIDRMELVAARAAIEHRVVFRVTARWTSRTTGARPRRRIVPLPKETDRRRVRHVAPRLSADRHRQRAARNAELGGEVRDPPSRKRLIPRQHASERHVRHRQLRGSMGFPRTAVPLVKVRSSRRLPLGHKTLRVRRRSREMNGRSCRADRCPSLTRKVRTAATG